MREATLFWETIDNTPPHEKKRRDWTRIFRHVNTRWWMTKVELWPLPSLDSTQLLIAETWGFLLFFKADDERYSVSHYNRKRMTRHWRDWSQHDNVWGPYSSSSSLPTKRSLCISRPDACSPPLSARAWSSTSLIMFIYSYQSRFDLDPIRNDFEAAESVVAET